ncbi:hypothetical protein CFP56_012876 [Quercus suber]|uniref:Uncharacterized protein n=1 Tax=Quercus suber TaxID=58331 RepID=A0AAW0KWJ2_QUESU
MALSRLCMIEWRKRWNTLSGSSGIILSDDSQFVNAAKVGHDLRSLSEKGLQTLHNYDMINR